MASYRVQVWSTDTSAGFGVGTLVAEFPHAKNIGYAHYLNDIGEAFWTIDQRDIHASSAVRNVEGTGHVKIIRNDSDVVWRGILAEHDANSSDAILYAYGYEHLFYTLLSKWNMTWTSQKVAGASGRPVNDLWALANGTYGSSNRYSNSKLAFASTGTIQAPVTTSDGATEITLESYKLYWRRILHAFKELVAIAVSDTTNVCYFELDYPSDPTDDSLTFNFWKDRASDLSTPRLVYPDTINEFSERYMPFLNRNVINAVGTGARQQLFRSTVTTSSGSRGTTTFGRAMEPILLSWVRDEAELDRVAALRAAKAQRINLSLYLSLLPDQARLLPMRASSSTHNLGDRLKVVIDRGVTQVDQMMFLSGEQVFWVHGNEIVQPIVMDRAGS